MHIYAMLHFSLNIFPDGLSAKAIPFTSVSLGSNQRVMLKDNISTG